MRYIKDGAGITVMSDDGDWVNGQVISVDGGITMQ